MHIPVPQPTVSSWSRTQRMTVYLCIWSQQAMSTKKLDEVIDHRWLKAKCMRNWTNITYNKKMVTGGTHAVNNIWTSYGCATINKVFSYNIAFKAYTFFWCQHYMSAPSKLSLVAPGLQYIWVTLYFVCTLTHYIKACSWCISIYSELYVYRHTFSNVRIYGPWGHPANATAWLWVQQPILIEQLYYTL